MRLWVIAAVGVLLVGVIAILAGERTYIGTAWVMVAALFVLFGWLVATVIARRVRKNQEP